MNRAHLTVAVVGATGVVGRTMIQVLNEREFPVGELRLLASGRSAGRTLSIDGRTLEIGEATPEAFEGVDIALFSRRRRHLEGARARGGRPRRDGHRQLVGLADGPDGPARRLAGQPGRPRGPRGHHRQPELLDDAARAGADGPARHGRARAGRRRHLPVRVGTGADAIAELEGQIRAHVAGEPKRADVYPHPIAFNALPEIDVFLPNGYTKEEWKVVTENRKILHLPDLRISCTAVRIPVFVSHSEAVHVETREPITPERAREPVRGASRASSSRTTRRPTTYPLATEAAGRDEIFVGRVRRDISIAGRPRARLLGRLGQPAQGRGDERRRARRGPRRARLGRARLGAGREPVPSLEPAVVAGGSTA